MASDHADTVSEYLKEQNRPYSATDIFNNLHKAIGKTALQRNLDCLVKSGSIVEKTYGKQKIYYASQENGVNPTSDNLDTINEEIQHVQQELASKSERLADVQSALRDLEAKISPKDCRAQLEKYKKLNQDLEMNLNQLTSSSGQPPVDPAERAALTKQRDSLLKMLEKRKKTLSEIVALLLESYPETRKKFVEEVGLELD